MSPSDSLDSPPETWARLAQLHLVSRAVCAIRADGCTKLQGELALCWAFVVEYSTSGEFSFQSCCPCDGLFLG